MLALLCAFLTVSPVTFLPRPYSVHGWERFPAPLVEPWLVLGTPVSDAPEFELPDGDHRPEPGTLEAGARWATRWSHGAPVRLDVSGGSIAALTWVNLRRPESGVRMHLSVRGTETPPRVSVNGRQVEGVPSDLFGTGDGPGGAWVLELGALERDGWNRVGLIFTGPFSTTPEFCVQLLAGSGEVIPYYGLTHLPWDRVELDQVYPYTGRIWKRLVERAQSALGGPYPDLGRLLVKARLRLAGDPRETDFRAAADLTRILVRGGARAEVSAEFERVSRVLGKVSSSSADKQIRWQRVHRALETIRPWVEARADRSDGWHLFDSVPHGDLAELWRRLGIARGLFLDLRDAAQEVLNQPVKDQGRGQEEAPAHEHGHRSQFV